MKRAPGDIIILHKCTKNHDHMLYCSSDMVCDRCNCTKNYDQMMYGTWDMVRDGQTDGQKKCYIEVVPHLKIATVSKQTSNLTGGSS